MRLLAVVAALSLATLPTITPASAEGELDVRVISVDDGAFPAITMVLAVEASERPVPSLAPDEIVVTDNGEAVSVKSVQRILDASIPTTVVVALDTSGSMAGASLVRAKEALSGLVSRLSPSDRVGLVSFSDRANLVAAPSATSSAVVAAVSGLQASGNTALYGAVAESARVAGSEGDARRLVILLTDGEEYGNVSGISREASIDRAVASGAIFYVIGLGVGADREYLNQLAVRTGGRYLDAPATADIERGFSSIEETLRGQFVVSLETSAPSLPIDREVSVRVTGAAGSGTATFRFSSTRQPTVPESTPTQLPTAAPSAAPAVLEVADEPSGKRSWAPAAGVGALVLLLVVGAVWRNRRSHDRNRVVNPVATPDPLVVEAAGIAHSEAPVARLVARDAEGQGKGLPAALEIRQSPASLGWSSDCQLRLPRAEGVAAVHARLWWRDGNLMLHDLSGGSTKVNGSSARWASLAPTDRLQFGPFDFEFVLLPGTPHSG